MYVLELAGEDDPFAAAEAAQAATEVEVIASGLAIAADINPDRISGLAYTHRASTLVGRGAASYTEAQSVLASHDLDLTGSVAVRARNIRGSTGIETRRVERKLGSQLVSRGYEIKLDDPDHELRVLFSDSVCVIGVLVCESVRDYGSRLPTDKPFFQPGAMDSLDARAIANLALTQHNNIILDPMCGTGGILVEAGLLGAQVIGMDAQLKMVTGTAQNLNHYLSTRFSVLRGDAGRIPIKDDAVDCVGLDLPYGRQSKIAGSDLESLGSDVLMEVRRVADRAVIVCDRTLVATAEEAGWKVEDVFARRVHRSLTRIIHILT